MRYIFLITAILAAFLLVLFWATGSFDQLALWAANGQRSFQNQMASTLQALRRGDAGAVASLMLVCFSYGFFHAIGPGHGKVLIGGYGLGTGIAMMRLAGIAVLSSLAQGLSAVLLVYAGVALLGISRQNMVGAAEDYFAPASYGAIVLLGLWLIFRGVRKIRRNRQQDQHHHHNHNHDHHHSGLGETCDECGHRHGPTPEEVSNIRSLRDLFLLVGAIAIRPCTGAIFLLILTWQLGLAMAGIAGTFAMALGTASVTVVVAIAATGLRESTLRGLSDGATARLVVPVLEIAAGLIVALVAVQLLRTAL